MDRTPPHHVACATVLTCVPAASGCAVTFAGERVEVLKQVSRHARAAHGVDQLPPAVLAAVLDGLRAR